MRRLIASIAALFIMAGFVAPAMASLQPWSASHACCPRHQQHKHECHGSDDDASSAEREPEPSDLHLHARLSCCTACLSPALISQPAARAREVVVVMPAPEHPFAQEFYPFDPPQPSTQATSERAPPNKKVRRFTPIQLLIAFVRHHI